MAINGVTQKKMAVIKAIYENFPPFFVMIS